jgi:excisionase family DNA binding protein
MPTTTETPRLLLDYLEAGYMLNVGRSTIYKLVASHDLEQVKIGKRTLITTASVEAYVARLTSGQVTE